MEEWLLFYGVALHSANVAPRNIEFSALVVADFADSHLSIGDRTTMAAGKAADSVTLDRLVEIALSNVLIQDFTEGRHEHLSGNFTPETTRMNARCDGNAATDRPACARLKSEKG
jgi:hypothetical protein